MRMHAPHKKECKAKKGDLLMKKILSVLLAAMLVLALAATAMADDQIVIKLSCAASDAEKVR